jgi:hypothetical protein
MITPGRLVLSQDANSYTRAEVDVQSAPPEKGGPAKKKSRKDDS